MDKKLLFLDCDPGVDDAVAILLALASPEAQVVGVSAVGGNVPLERTLRNALDIVSFAGRADIPVYPGARMPMTGEPVTAEEFHGADGLGGVPIPQSQAQAQSEPAWDAIHRLAKAHPGKLTVVATGPLTNLGIALTKWTDLAGLLQEIVIMGGASTYGNTTPAAEFNFLADPEGAEAVFQSGANITVLPLDVTHKCYVNREEIAKLRSLSTPQAHFAAEMMDGGRVEQCESWFGVPGSIMHDPAAALYALRPELFTAKTCWVGVETGGVHSRGKMVTDAFTDASREANCRLCYDVDREGFVEALLALMGRY